VTRTRTILVAALAAAPGLGGCIAELEPDVGPPTHEICNDADGDPDREISFARDIDAAIIRADRATACVHCHDETERNPIGYEIADLDLSSYENLRRGGANSRDNIVVPGAPCRSVLYGKVYEGPPFGSRMPFNGPPFLEEHELAAIHDWIAEGAHDN
jgi:hypothetical protein